jgi:hypothetical protein
MIWLAHLFRRNHDARRARWFVFGACMGALVIELAYDRTMITQAQAADPDVCHKVGQQLGSIVFSATDDIDLQQAVEASAEAHCILLDEPPVAVRIEKQEAIDPGRLPDASPTDGGQLSAKDQWCRKHFRSFRVSDGTVLRPGYRRRVACPWPG